MNLLLLSILLFCINSSAEAKVPRSILPKSIELELQDLSKEFSKVLKKECSSNCYSNSCSYGNHKVVKEQDSRLPGLNFSDKPSTKLDYQYYLTSAVCNYAYEGDISDTEIKKLNQRLQAKLSNASLKVSIKSKKLSEAITKEETLLPEEMTAKILNSAISVLPYILVLLALLFSTILFIWALRRVGKESFAEKLKRLNLEKEMENDHKEDTPIEVSAPGIDVEKFIEDNIDNDTMRQILRSWLKTEKHQLIFSLAAYTSAKDKVFFSDKIELFKEKKAYYESIEAGKLTVLSKEPFIAELKKSLAVNKGLQDRTINLFDSLNSSIDIISLGSEMKKMPIDFACLIFVLSNATRQKQLLSRFTDKQKHKYLERLLSSPIFARAYPEYLYEWLECEEKGEKFDYTKIKNISSVAGIDFEVNEAVNRLLNAVEDEERSTLLQATKENYGGTMPKHLEGIFYKDLLIELDPNILTNLVSYVDTRKLALYLDQMFSSDDKQRIISNLPQILGDKLQKSDRSLVSRKDTVILEVEKGLADAMSKMEL